MKYFKCLQSVTKYKKKINESDLSIFSSEMCHKLRYIRLTVRRDFLFCFISLIDYWFHRNKIRYRICCKIREYLNAFEELLKVFLFLSRRVNINYTYYIHIFIFFTIIEMFWWLLQLNICIARVYNTELTSVCR